MMHGKKHKKLHKIALKTLKIAKNLQTVINGGPTNIWNLSALKETRWSDETQETAFWTIYKIK